MKESVPTSPSDPVPPVYDEAGNVVRIERTDARWRADLTPEQFLILREGGTEPPHRNAYWNHEEDGLYACAGCGLPLFDSTDKIESCSGWPSFGAPLDPRHVEEITDGSHGMVRIEAVCARCGGHLGHVFEDGPPPSGRRY